MRKDSGVRDIWIVRVIWRGTQWLVFEPQLMLDTGPDPGLDTDSPARNYKMAIPDSHAIYCFGGRLRINVSGWVPLTTLVLVIVPGIVFWTTTASLVWHRIHPSLVVVLAYAWTMATVNFMAAAFVDPGTLPRNIHLPSRLTLHHQLEYDPPEYKNAILLPHHSRFPVTVRFCAVCLIWRPPRTAHCYVCNACCLLQDHHCVFLANCVGARNYHNFLWFLAWICCTGAIMGLTSLACLFLGPKGAMGISSEIKLHPAALFVTCYTLVAIIYPFSLLILHFFLTLHNYLMREFLTSIYKAKEPYLNPFDLGSIWKNWYYLWIGRIHMDMMIPKRDVHINGDIRYIKVMKD